ncbi:hypothetical protein RERY_00690 [Rhodococcus erythropolis]|nr:hypothetical protein RERY_00690 [Rhodococcus erythropolis]
MIHTGRATRDDGTKQILAESDYRGLGSRQIHIIAIGRAASTGLCYRVS